MCFHTPLPSLETCMPDVDANSTAACVAVGRWAVDDILFVEPLVSVPLC